MCNSLVLLVASAMKVNDRRNLQKAVKVIDRIRLQGQCEHKHMKEDVSTLQHAGYQPAAPLNGLLA